MSSLMRDDMGARRLSMSNEIVRVTLPNLSLPPLC